MAIAYLCLGSNIGDRVGYVQQATKMLVESGDVTIVRSSALYETEPWGKPDQCWFLNAVIEVNTNLKPKELLNLCLETEKHLGRDRDKEIHWSSRTIDIDILLYDDIIYEDEDLIIPHKHLHERAFALVPLLELVPDLIHPKYKKSLLELHEAIENPEDIVLFGTRFDEL
ncbi:2-amino-4-hydroxy-6-hydroxymethyldihydropteridine diphosphokinase [bacterium]|nr:2-amino-4-hydroxy-6-hydroxymethyldihydropteridine diphosphokinase [bacterium]